MAIRKDAKVLKYIHAHTITSMTKEQIIEMCLTAIKRNSSLTLKLIQKNKHIISNLEKNQIQQLYLAAVEQDGFALEYITDQTDEICLKAVQQNGFALRHIKNQTIELCDTAYKQNFCSVIWAREKLSRIQ
jgi:hypothetical protein